MCFRISKETTIPHGGFLVVENFGKNIVDILSRWYIIELGNVYISLTLLELGAILGMRYRHLPQCKLGELCYIK